MGESNPSERPRNIVSGQWVEEVKVQRAKELRRKMTPAEYQLWQRVRKNQLAGLHFRRQQVIAGFIADFYCHSAGLVVEVDGPIHARQTDYDAERDRIFESLGIIVLRVSNDDVIHRLQDVLQQMESECNRRTRCFESRETGETSPLSGSPPALGEGLGEGFL